MKSRLRYLATYYLELLLVFVVQKPLFMLYCGAAGRGVALGDYFRVVWHGLGLDATVAAYLTVVPWLAVTVSHWVREFPLRKVLTPYHIIVALLVSVIFCADASLYPFWDFKLDASVFLYLDSPKDALASVSWGFVAVGVLVILLLTVGLAWLLVRTTPRRLPEMSGSWLARVSQMVAMLLVGGLVFVGMRGGLSESTANVGKSYFCNDQFLNHAAVNPHFSLFYSLGKQEDFAGEFDFFDEPQRAALVEGLFPDSAENDTTLSLLTIDRPNVLLIIMEGFGGVFVEDFDGASGVAPQLGRLADEGVFFTNCYAGSFRTDRGMVCVLSAFPGLPTASVMKLPAKSRTLPAISEELVKAGYRTDFLYGGDINFTNTKSFLLSKGYQHITSDVDFSSEERGSCSWGVSDEMTFDRLYRELVQRKGGPWHTAFLTLSSHEPFDVPYHRFDDPVANAFSYTDSCLGSFVDRLKDTPVWDSLLIVCVPDHGFVYPSGAAPHAPRIHHIPMLWLGGAVRQPMRVDKLMNQTDLAATLLAQMHLDHSRFAYSRNVMGGGYRYPFAFYTFNNGFAFIDSTGASVYDNTGRHLIHEDNITPEGSRKRLDQGKALLQTLYDDLGRR